MSSVSTSWGDQVPAGLRGLPRPLSYPPTHSMAFLGSLWGETGQQPGPTPWGGGGSLGVPSTNMTLTMLGPVQ